MQVAADGETPAMKFSISRRVPCLVRTISASLGHASGVRHQVPPGTWDPPEVREGETSAVTLEVTVQLDAEAA